MISFPYRCEKGLLSLVASDLPCPLIRVLVEGVGVVSNILIESLSVGLNRETEPTPPKPTRWVFALVD